MSLVLIRLKNKGPGVNYLGGVITVQVLITILPMESLISVLSN